jgi:hypothetical protein
VKYGLRLKKELSVEHIIQNLKTRWKHSDRGNKRLICFKNEELTYERGTGAAPEYSGSNFLFWHRASFI